MIKVVQYIETVRRDGGRKVFVQQITKATFLGVLIYKRVIEVRA